MMHAPKKYLFILLLTAFIPVISALESFAQESKLEKVYIHTDKSQYAINDTIWFTGYVTEGNKNIASRISKVIYVDLLDQADSVLKRAKLELINGSATGHFGLRGDANQGLFRIRAYTLWMRNFDKQYFFNKSIRIGGSSAKINNKPTKYDAEFLPEGGELINNIPGKVAFKAIDEQGRGVDVTGHLKKEKGEELVRFKSQHYGMGIFNFTPQAGIKYIAHMVFPDGSQKQYTLQEAKKSGYSLAVVQSADSLNIQIKCTKENSKDVRLIIKSPGLPEYVQPLSNSSFQTAISIAKENLPIGINQISLIDNANQVLAKRLVFIRNAKTLKLDIIPKKAVYKKGSRMSININAITPNGFDNTGNFSLSVAEISADLKEEDEVTIQSNLLLSSELKGYVENPNYYIIAEDTTRQMYMDYLMLTQQYRPDQAEELVDPKFAPETNGMYATGLVKTILENKPAAGARVTLLTLNGGIMEETDTDLLGRFKIEGLKFLEGMKFTVQAKSKLPGVKLKVLMDNIMPEAGSPRRKNSEIPNSQQSTITGSSIINEKFLKDNKKGVKVAGSKQRIVFTEQVGLVIDQSKVDRSIYLNNPELCPNLAICLQGLAGEINFKALHGVKNYPFHQDGAMTVYVDGRQVIDTVELAGIFDYNELLAENIGRIDIVKAKASSAALTGALSSPMMLILTKKSIRAEDTYVPEYSYYLPYGYTPEVKFYSSRNKVPVTNYNSNTSKTVYWNGKLSRAENGVLGCSFINSNQPGKYRVTVEGISSSGYIGRQTFDYTVE